MGSLKGNIQPITIERTRYQNQIIVCSNSFTITETDKVCAIFSMYGTGITLQDINGNNIITNGTNLFNLFTPLLLEGGFIISGTNLTVVYGVI